MCSLCSLWLKWVLVFTSLVATPASAQIQQAWVARYNNGITNGTNQAVKMALDSAGNIYVTGFSQNANTNLGYVTIKYAPNGNQLWAARYVSTNFPTATPSAMVLDASNNVIVAGSALTVKYDFNGNQLWTAPYAGTALAVDSNGNIAVTGFGSSFNTVELSPSGSYLWQGTYPSSSGAAVGQAIAADTSGNIYVAGCWPFTFENILYYDLLAIKYSPTGTQLWEVSDQGYGYLPQVEAAVLDTSTNLYIEANFYKGYAYNDTTSAIPYFTYKFANDGTMLWIANNPTDNSLSQAQGLALDTFGDAIIAGRYAAYPRRAMEPIK